MTKRTELTTDTKRTMRRDLQAPRSAQTTRLPQVFGNKRGSYILEAVLFLPLIVLAILSFGYFTRVEGVWENIVHCAVDESARSQAMAWDGISGYAAKEKVKRRIEKDERCPSSFSINSFHADYSAGGLDHLNSFDITANQHMALPAGFSRDFTFTTSIVYRGFVGSNIRGDPLGVSGLEDGIPGDPAYIFPAFGEKYHTALCTYVKATVHGERLGSSIRKVRDSCRICHSEKLPDGSIVFCFNTSGTAYHRASCRTIQRHVIVIDRSEAAEKGYTPCSKCGG